MNIYTSLEVTQFFDHALFHLEQSLREAQYYTLPTLQMWELRIGGKRGCLLKLATADESAENRPLSLAGLKEDIRRISQKRLKDALVLLRGT